MKGSKKILFYSAALIVGLFFLVWGLLNSKGVLAPLLTAIILALVILPLAQWAERFMSRNLSTWLSTFALFIVSLGFIALLSYQAKVFMDSWPEIRETMEPKVEQWKNYVTENTFVEAEDFNSLGGSGNSIQSRITGNVAYIATIFGRGTGYLGTYLLTFIYVFFLLNYRHHFREFTLRLFDDDKQSDVNQTIRESASVVQQYLSGKLILIGLLAITYAIGLGITGVNNFILVSIVAALFTLIPYIGNIIGFGIAMLFGYLTSGEAGILIGIIITFSIAQFLESYVLQPFIIGDKVGVHPFFVILAVIIGNAIWGIIGMILAIPIIGILTIVFLNVPALEPFGYLFSDKKNS